MLPIRLDDTPMPAATELGDLDWLPEKHAMRLRTNDDDSSVDVVRIVQRIGEIHPTSDRQAPWWKRRRLAIVGALVVVLAIDVDAQGHTSEDVGLMSVSTTDGSIKQDLQRAMGAGDTVVEHGSWSLTVEFTAWVRSRIGARSRSIDRWTQITTARCGPRSTSRRLVRPC